MPVTTAEIVTLNDGTFEHQTQASTGMTTGSWLVLFTGAGCEACAPWKQALVDLEASRSEEDDEGESLDSVVLATVDAGESIQTSLRFTVEKVPTMIYLHKKRLYEVDLSAEFLDLKEFVKSIDSKPSKDIPAPMSPFSLIVQMAERMGQGSHGIAGYVVLGMAGVLGLTVLVLIITLILGNGSEKGKSDKKKKKS